eukprot:COSAG02_NODE_10608_length_1901_cov_1.272475_1_plen_593_part_00
MRPALHVALVALALALRTDGDSGVLPCTIPRIDAMALTTEDFLESHRHRSPLLIRGMMTQWRAQSRWTWEFFLGSSAATTRAVNVGTGASLAASGLASARPSLTSFVQRSVLQKNSSNTMLSDDVGDPLYVFDGDFFSGGGRETLRRDFDLPLEYFPFQTSQENVTFFAGRAGSGLGFHKHGEAINALVRGRKRWLLYRPESLSLAMGMDASLSGNQWLQGVYPTLPPDALPDYECVQEAGEIMCESLKTSTKLGSVSCFTLSDQIVAYLLCLTPACTPSPRAWPVTDLPALYHHATVNLEDSLGVATRQASNARVTSVGSTNSLADAIEEATARMDHRCAAAATVECAGAQSDLAALLMEAGRVAEAHPLLQAAVADKAVAPRQALMLHGELLLRRGRWYAPITGAASVLRAYDSEVSRAQAAEAATEEQGPVKDVETLTLGGERHIFTGPSTWREAALRELCPLSGSNSSLKNCYHLTMAAILADSPRFKLATQAGRWALRIVASAATTSQLQPSASSGSSQAMADDGYHIHGIQLAMCRAYAYLAREHPPQSKRAIKRWAKAESHCQASIELKPKYEVSFRRFWLETVS